MSSTNFTTQFTPIPGRSTSLCFSSRNSCELCYGVKARFRVGSCTPRWKLSCAFHSFHSNFLPSPFKYKYSCQWMLEGRNDLAPFMTIYICSRISCLGAACNWYCTNIDYWSNKKQTKMCVMITGIKVYFFYVIHGWASLGCIWVCCMYRNKNIDMKWTHFYWFTWINLLEFNGITWIELEQQQ